MSLGYHRGDKQAYLAEAQRVAGVEGRATTVPVRTEFATREDANLSTPAPLEVQSPLSPKQMGYTGNTCTHCNGTRMQVAGHCEVCLDCGTSSGCS